MSDEFSFARVSVILFGFSRHLVLAKLATSSIRVNPTDGQVLVFIGKPLLSAIRS